MSHASTGHNLDALRINFGYIRAYQERLTSAIDFKHKLPDMLNFGIYVGDAFDLRAPRDDDYVALGIVFAIKNIALALAIPGTKMCVMSPIWSDGKKTGLLPWKGMSVDDRIILGRDWTLVDQLPDDTIISSRIIPAVNEIWRLPLLDE